MPGNFDELHQYLRLHEAELIALHREIVRVPSVNHGDGSSAREDEVAAVLAGYFRDCGLRPRALAAEPHRDNFIVELDSGTPGPVQLWMSHTDVVPAGDETAWSHPPFSAALDQGRIWGRGANDCKMLVAAQAFVVASLARLGILARGKIRLIAAADEEAGGRKGFGWLAQEHPDLLRAEIAICEGGGSCLGSFEGHAPLISVGVGEKGRYDVAFVARGEGGHAAAPWGKLNPIAQLGVLLARIGAWISPAHPASPVFGHLSELAGLHAGIDAENLEIAIVRIGEHSAALARSLRAQSRMTLTPTMLQGGDTSNALPTEARLICDSRLLPGQKVELIEAAVRQLAAGLEGVEASIKENAPASACEMPAPLLHAFERAASAATGQPVRIVPTWCTGATDAHWVRALSTPVYGFQLMHPAAESSRLGIHCIDESIEASLLLSCAVSHAHLALDFAANAD